MSRWVRLAVPLRSAVLLHISRPFIRKEGPLICLYQKKSKMQLENVAERGIFFRQRYDLCCRRFHDALVLFSVRMPVVN